MCMQVHGHRPVDTHQPVIRLPHTERLRWPYLPRHHWRDRVFYENGAQGLSRKVRPTIMSGYQSERDTCQHCL